MQSNDLYNYCAATNILRAIDFQVPLKFFEFCFDGYTQINALLAEEVCKIGNLEMLRFLYDNNCPFDSRVYKAAKYNCHTRCLQFLEQIGCNENTPINHSSFVLNKPKSILNSSKNNNKVVSNDDIDEVIISESKDLISTYQSKWVERPIHKVESYDFENLVIEEDRFEEVSINDPREDDFEYYNIFD
jgi:hypothetical protein